MDSLHSVLLGLCTPNHIPSGPARAGQSTISMDGAVFKCLARKGAKEGKEERGDSERHWEPSLVAAVSTGSPGEAYLRLLTGKEDL